MMRTAKFLSVTLSSILMSWSITSNASAAEGCLDAVKERGVLRSANGLQGLRPWVWQKDDGSYTGFEAELFEEIAKRIGVKAEYIITEWTTIIPGLKSDRWDILLTGLAITQERVQSAGITYSDPYLIVYDVAMVLGNSPLKSLDDLKGKVVGTTMGSTDSLVAHAFVDAGRAKEVMDFNGYGEPFMALRNNQVDAVIMDQVTLIGQRELIPDLRALDGEPLPYRAKPEWEEAESKTPYKMGAFGIGMRPECEDLKQAINEALASMNADGTRKAILQKYEIWDDAQEEKNMRK